MLALSQVAGRWSALPRVVRLFASLGAFGLCLLSMALAMHARPSQIALFATPIHPDQLTEVEEQLAGWNVTFTPTNDNILIDAGQRNDLLLRLSLAGVPHSHLSSTSEALASIGVLTPQAVIEAQTRAGLAGDIEAGLRGIDGVDDARVIVAAAKAPEFADETPHDASASVRLRLRPGISLSRDVIGGIRAFVAASVPELDAARVTILDDRGAALDEQTAAGDAAALEGSLQSALDTVFGLGAAVVRVRAEYDSERSSEHDVTRAPAAGAAILRTQQTESYDASGKRYRKKEEGEDRGSEVREALSQRPPGALKRISAAVFIDRSRALDVAKVRTLAAATLAYDVRRGDKLAVESVNFYHSRPPHVRRWRLLYGAIASIAPALVLALGLVAAARYALPSTLALIQTLSERSLVERFSRGAKAFPPARVRSLLEREPPHAAAAIISALPAATATAVLDLYPPHEREAIVNRMQRPHMPILSDAHELLRRRV